MRKTMLAGCVAMVMGSAAPNALSEDSDGLFETMFRDVRDWRVVVDGVMGGLSTGRMSQPDDGVLRFSGELSLENNGGFSQIRRAVDGDAFESTDAIALDVRGDGRVYTFDVRTSNARLMAGGFQREFQTTAGEWVTLTLALDDFRLYNFGRPVRNAPDLDPSLIESIGITLADKKSGAFEIDVRSIKAVRQASGSAAATDASTNANAKWERRLERLVDRLGLDGAEDDAESTSPATADAPRDIMRVFALAIERGVPMFNAGHHEACANVYEVAMGSVLLLCDDGFDPTHRETLRGALERARRQHSWAERAWTYRRAIDRVSSAMSHTISE